MYVHAITEQDVFEMKKDFTGNWDTEDFHAQSWPGYHEQGFTLMKNTTRLYTDEEEDHSSVMSASKQHFL